MIDTIMVTRINFFFFKSPLPYGTVAAFLLFNFFQVLIVLKTQIKSE